MKKFVNIDWESLTIANNYVFLEVMKNKELCKQLVEQILHIQIKDIHYLETEKNISARLASKSVRLDVYVEDEHGTVINLEMQVTGKNSTVYRDTDEETVIRELPLRVRYYQSLISMDMLRKGMDYPDLRKSYVIFICTFDPFGKGRPLYSFRYRSNEDASLEMGDLTENIYLNAKAADMAADKELAAFLSYVNGKAAESAFTQAIDRETVRVKSDDAWRDRVMTWEMDMRVMQRHTAEKAEKKGEKKKAIEIAKRLLKKGTMSIGEIAEATSLTTQEVSALE